MAASGDGELIELIDVDPAAFGPTPHAAASDRHREGRPRRDIPWRTVLLGLTAAATLAAIVIGVLAWRPWYTDPRLVLDDPHPRSSVLSERLVFDHPPAALRTVSIPDVTDTTFDDWNDASIGYFFAQPGATFTPDDGDDRWFGFYAQRSDAQGAPRIFGQRTIGGAPAEVSDESDGALTRLAWGPVDGQTFIAAASNMSVDDAVAIAEQLRITNGRPVLLNRAALDGLVPLGPFGAYVPMMMLADNIQDQGRDLQTMVGLYYGFKGQSIVSVPAPEDAVRMTPFLMSKSAVDRTVHGRPAFGYTKSTGPFGWTGHSTVVWWEGGRLITVNGDSDLDATFALAETVRTATDAEWAAALALAQPS